MPHSYSQRSKVQIGQSMADLSINGIPTSPTAASQSPPQIKMVSKELPPLPGQLHQIPDQRVLNGSNSSSPSEGGINASSHAMQGQTVQLDRIALPHMAAQSSSPDEFNANS
ncbi:hypothetical protein BGZ80_001744, partial [Entomortierella chlamydospora]